MKILPDLGETQHRRAHPAGQDVEGDELADRQVAADHEPGAEIQDACRDDLADELHRLAGAIAETEHPETRGHVSGELLLPAPLHLRFDRHRLDGLGGRNRFDQKRLIVGAAREFLVESAPETRRH